MQDSEIVWLGIEGLHAALGKGVLSAAEIVDALLRRIDELDPQLQAYSVVWPERVRRRDSTTPRPRRTSISSIASLRRRHPVAPRCCSCQPMWSG